MSVIQPELYRIPVEISGYPEIKYVYFIWPILTLCDNIHGTTFEAINQSQTRLAQLIRKVTYFVDTTDQNSSLVSRLKSKGFENVYVVNSGSYCNMNEKRFPMRNIFNILNSNYDTSSGNWSIVFPALIVADVFGEDYPKYQPKHKRSDNSISTNITYAKYYIPVLYTKDDIDTTYITCTSYNSTTRGRSNNIVMASTTIVLNNYYNWSTSSFTSVSWNFWLLGALNSNIFCRAILLPNKYGIVGTPLNCDFIECVSSEKLQLSIYHDGWLMTGDILLDGGRIIFNGSEDSPGYHIYGNVVLSVGSVNNHVSGVILYERDYYDPESSRTIIKSNNETGTQIYKTRTTNNPIYPYTIIHGNLNIHDGEIIYSNRIPYDWNFTD